MENIICIKTDQSIINDKFYNNKIQNNKYYSTFHDCIPILFKDLLIKHPDIPYKRIYNPNRIIRFRIINITQYLTILHMKLIEI